MSEQLAVEMEAVHKSFNGVPVLHGVDFDLRRGEVHALLGENGAGKSTLMKILQGVYAPDGGEVRVDGRDVRLGSTHDARAAGIGMVFQEFSLVPTLSVARNVFLAREPRGRFGLVDDGEVVRRTRAVFAQMSVDIDPRTTVGSLSTAYWQLTEIAKALAQNARVLIMDEPTASLARHEAEALFALVGRLKAAGISIIYISHRMEEVYRVADRVTVLRDGRRVVTAPLADVSPAQLIEHIIGRRMENAFAWRERTVDRSGTPILELRELSAGPRVRDVSLTLHRGEVLGLAGLMGSGRTELARTLFGIDRARAGQVLVDGRPVDLTSPRAAMAAGIALIPEDRREQGLVLDHSVRDNLLLPLLSGLSRGPLLNDRRGSETARSLIDRLRIRVANAGRPVRLLSGGNQQKVVIAKWLATDPEVLVMDEPTVGVDVGTKSEIITTIRDLADQGKAIIVISSELPELLAVSDRIVVLRAGAVDRELDRRDIPDEEHLQMAIQGV